MCPQRRAQAGCLVTWLLCLVWATLPAMLGVTPQSWGSPLLTLHYTVQTYGLMVTPLLLVILIHSYIICTLYSQHHFRDFNDYKNITITTIITGFLLILFFVKYFIDKLNLLKMKTLDELLVNEHRGFASLYVVSTF